MKLHPGISTAALADLLYLHKDKELFFEFVPPGALHDGLVWAGVHLVTVTNFITADNYINLYNTATGEGTIGHSDREIVLYRTTPEMIQAIQEGAK